MSKTINLPEEVFTALEQAAAAHGQTPAEWIAAHLPVVESQPPRTGKDFADYLRQRSNRWRSDTPANTAENHSEEFGKILEQKRQEGNL